MGIVNFGIPIDDARHLRDCMGLEVAVEGGTFMGGTAKQLSGEFTRVYTIEKSEAMFARAKDRLSGIQNVNQILGDTRASLEVIMSSEDRILFWLDAHWSGGETYGDSDECPLMAELQAIFSYGKHCAILIDDARLFLMPPPLPHDASAWPTIAEIASVVPENWDFLVKNDVIYLVPKQADFRAYMQEQSTWAAGPSRLRKHVSRLINKVLGG